jgi:drug/metabolite transporter (DMT)-like permease
VAGPRGWLGFALSFLGTVAIVPRGGLAALVTVDIHIGSLWSLLGAMSFAWFSLRVRDWSREISSLSLTTVTAWFGFLLTMAPVYLLWLFAGGEVVSFRVEDETRAWASVIYVALGPTLLGNVFYLFGVSVVGPQRAAAFLYLSPIFAALLSVAFLGEALHLFHFAGFALIVIGLVVVNTSAPPKTAQE